jgi:hypothetical protein
VSLVRVMEAQGHKLVSQGKDLACREALLDALTFWNARYRNVTSCYGVDHRTKRGHG